MDEKELNGIISDIVGKVIYNKECDRAKKDNTARYKVYNRDIEQFLKRSCDKKEFKKGKVWNVVVPEESAPKNWIEELERNVQLHLKNKR